MADDTIRKRAPFQLAFMTDLHRLPDQEEIIRTMPTGSAVILRDYRAKNRQSLAVKYSTLCKTRSVKFFVGGDSEIASTVEADGLHLPEFAKASFQRKNWTGPISASCHSLNDLIDAHNLGADIGFLSPVFATKSHTAAITLGAQQFHEIASQSPIPVLALGGIDAGNARKLSNRNVVGFGAIGAFAPPQ